MARSGWLFLAGVVLAGCGRVELPTPRVEPEAEARASEPAAPLEARSPGAGGEQAPSEPELLPQEWTGSGLLRLEPRHEEVAVPYAVFSWGARSQGPHTLLRITTRPKGTREWPWLTLEAWVRAPRGLEEWVGREIAVQRFEYMPGQGLAPWGLGGRAFLVIRDVQPGRLNIDVHLELKDPMDGSMQRLVGRLAAAEAAAR